MPMKEAVVILPNQLVSDHPALDKERDIYLVEHSRYFTDFAFHKQKIMLHRASMKEYAANLKRRKYRVQYLEYKKAKTLFTVLKKNNISILHCVDPVDHTVKKELLHEAKKKNIQIILYESPLFLCDTEWIEKEYGNKKSFFMQPFYVKQRKRLDILVRNNRPVGGAWSFDSENRESLPERIKVPTVIKSRENKYTKEARQYVEKHFKKNPGYSKTFIYPTSHDSAKKWLDRFFKKRFAQFGPYQDAINTSHPFLFHSLLSPLLNTGLLTPDYVIEQTLSYAKKHKIPINSLEGFIRQIIGWREFVRMVYHLIGEKQAKSNFFKHRKSLPKSFWNASTKILPIDVSIEKALEYAYGHHIERLMVLGNFMLLSQIKPSDVHKWFMELFIDSYDWVMVPNVYGMSQYADGGMMTTKPYITSSNYILKMSNFKKEKWCDTWNKLFWKFIEKHYTTLKKIPRMNLILNSYKKKRSS